VVVGVERLADRPWHNVAISEFSLDSERPALM